MEKFVSDNIGQIIMYGLFISFQIGFYFKSFKSKPTKSEVYSVVKTELETHKKDCRYYPESDGKVVEQKYKDIKDDVCYIKNRLDKIYDKIISEN